MMTMSPRKASPVGRAGVVLLPLLLAGCVTAPFADRPIIPPTTVALESRAAIVLDHPALVEASVPSDWWTLFDDPVLLALEGGIEDNLDLQAAILRIEESRSQLGLIDSVRRPNLSAETGYSRAAISENSPTHRLGAPTSGYDTWSLGLQAGWELDFWGHQRRLGDSARASLEASYFGKEAARVSITAEIARTYLLLRGVQAETALTEANLGIARDLARMVESRERHGVGTRFDTASARADALALEAGLTRLNQQRDVLMNTLALLLGKPPRELDDRLFAAALPAMPERLPIGVPSELALSRPDILQADAKLRAAVADIGAAQADFYPRVRLTGSLGVQGFDPSDLGSWASRSFAAGPVLHLPIFQGGRLRSQLALTETRHKLAGAAYQQTVLRAWHEVDDALNAYVSETRRHEQLEAVRAQQQEALTAAQRAYQGGSADFTTVLVSRRDLLAADAALNEATTASALAVVSLYRALGGGWSPEFRKSPDAS